MRFAIIVLSLILVQPGAWLWAQAPKAEGKEGEKGSAPASSAGEIGAPQLVGLPLNGRSYSQLATLQAGVSDSSAEQSSRGGGGGSLTAAGGRPTSNNFLLDGTNIMDTSNSIPRSAAGVQLGSDAVLQVQVFSANYTADYGRSSGAVLNSITRSGTESLHGTLFEYFRNSKLDARNFFDPDKPPPFKRNQFGFTLTGPLIKSHTFFMASFEALRDRLNETLVNYFPDAQARQGLITDVAGNVTQVVQVAPSVKPYLEYYPLPNSTRVGRGTAQNRSPVFLPTSETFFTVRLDHKISEHDGIFGRYTIDNASSRSTQGVFLFSTVSQTRFQYLTLVESHVFHPQMFGTLRFGFTRPASSNKSIGIQIPSALYFVPGADHFGQIFHAGLTPFGPSEDLPSGNIMNSFQFSGDLWASKGGHALRFGVELHRYRWNVFSGLDKGATWRFSSLENYLTAGAGGGASLTVALPGSDNSKNYRQTLMGFSVQDGFTLLPRLQLSVGLRYEFATMLHDNDGKTAFLADPLRDTAVTRGPYIAVNPSLRNFAPRLSLAWSPFGNGKTVLRSGFGIYYDQLLAYVVDSRKSSLPFHQEVIRTNFDASSFFPHAVDAALVAPVAYNAQVMDYANTKSPMVLRYNVSIQQQLASGIRLQAAYVGARGNHLYRSYEANLFPVPVRKSDGSLFFPATDQPLNPVFGGGVNILATDAQSFYNSLQVTFSKNFAPGISVQGNYTYSKSVDDASTIGLSAGTPQSGQVPFALIRGLERGLSDFDIRHRLAISYFYTVSSHAGKGWWNSPALSPIVQGWRLGGIVSYRSGAPFSPLVNVATPGSLFSATRPNLLPGYSNNPVSGVSTGCGRVAAGQKLGTADQYFDPCAFGLPDPGTLGNLGRNTIISSGVLSLDLSLQKDIRLPYKKQLQFRAEIFNLANRANFNRITTGSLTVFSGYPGRLNPTAGAIASTVTTARQIQFALRLSF